MTDDERPPRGFCPLHEFEHRRCSDYCLPERLEMRTLGIALSMYWRQRRAGMKPLDLAVYRAKYGR